MQTKYLVKAKIIPVYVNKATYRKSIVIFLSDVTIYLYPKKGGLLLLKNRKYSIRRLLRWALKGCIVSMDLPKYIPSRYPDIYLKRDDLELMINNKEIIINIENETFNTRK